MLTKEETLRAAGTRGGGEDETAMRVLRHPDRDRVREMVALDADLDLRGIAERLRGHADKARRVALMHERHGAEWRRLHGAAFDIEKAERLVRAAAQALAPQTQKETSL